MWSKSPPTPNIINYLLTGEPSKRYVTKSTSNGYHYNTPDGYRVVTSKPHADSLVSLEQMLTKIYNSKLPGNRNRNYDPSTFARSEQFAITIIYKDEEVIGFSTLCHRPLHFSPDTVRVLNRFWCDPEHTWNMIRYFTVASLVHQLNIAKQNPIFKYGFISREALNPKYMPMASKVFSSTTQYESWDHPTELIRTCSDCGNSSCWQHVSYTSLHGDNPSQWEMLQNSLSHKDFKTKFRGPKVHPAEDERE